MTATIDIVDQDAAVRESLAALLQFSGYTTRTFADGAAFLADQRLIEANCVLLDTSPPNMISLAIL